MPIGTSAPCAKPGVPARPTSEEAPSPAMTCRRFSRPFESVMASLRCCGVRVEFEECGGGTAVVDLQRLVEAIEEAGHGDAQRQFDDLGFVEMQPQPLEHMVADAAGVLGDQRG